MTARRVLVVRLDSLGDVLVCGPAVRAVARSAAHVSMLVSRRGREAARLLPGVDDVLVWDCPWISAPPPAVDEADIDRLVHQVRSGRFDAALILTSFHQSALPTALLLQLAGIGEVAAVSVDYPGALLSTRIAPPADAPEPVRMLAVARAAGYELAPDDDGRLRIASGLLPPVELPAGRYTVVHPGTDAPARAYPASSWRAVVAQLTARGRTVVVTGSGDEAPLVHDVASAAQPPGCAVETGGRTSLAELATIARGADVVAVANTGPAHLAAAVGTPVVSLFAPVVPAVRWAPYGVASAVLGDQDAACAGTRARTCPVPGHPCLTGVPAARVVEAMEQLAAARHDRDAAVVPA